MKKPVELKELIEELSNAGLQGSVDATSEAEATIHLGEDGADGIQLNREEVVLLFQTPESVEQLMEAIGSPEASVTFRGIDLRPDVLDKVEQLFIAVDED